jgi:beta-glucosidase-like glycosyl hydrolase
MPGDITFESGTSYFGANLTAYVQNGIIPMSRVDDMATRIIASWYFVHQDDPSYPATNFDAFNPTDDSTNSRVDAQGDGEHAKLVREMGAASTVLLKNVNGALPLKRGDGKKGMSLALLGSDAGPGRVGPNQFSDQGGVDGILAMGWGSGCVLPVF